MKRSLLWGVVVFKFATFSLAFVLARLEGDYAAGYHQAFHCVYSLPWPRGQEISWASALAAWDGGVYLKIARDGYERGSPLCAFYPLWPALISPGHALLGDTGAFWLALLLSNVFSVMACGILYDHLVRDWDVEISALAVALLMASPGAIFFSLIYTESLFLLLSVGALAALRSGRLATFCILSFLMPLAKAVGIFVILAPLCALVSTRQRKYFWATSPAVAGWLAYLAVMWLFTGDPFIGFKAQRYFLNRPSVANIFDLGQITAAAGRWYDLCDPVGGALDRILFAAFLVGVLCSRAIRREDLLFALGVGLVPCLSNYFLSYTRFFSACFPVFLGFAGALHRTKSSIAPRLVVTASTCVQLYCFVRYFEFKWAG